MSENNFKYTINGKYEKNELTINIQKKKNKTMLQKIFPCFFKQK